MGCVSSTLHDDLSQLNVSSLTHHFVKLTSSTYGLLNLDPPPPPPDVISSPMTPHERLTISGKYKDLISESTPEVINFWELMSSLDSSPLPMQCNNNINISDGVNKENSDPSLEKNPKDGLDVKENRVVIYTTSLRGVRRTFEACNAVRAAVESFGVVVCERDVSMDKGFKEELASLMSNVEGDDKGVVLLPRVFVKGKYIGGGEEVKRLVEEGLFGDLLSGIPKRKDRGGGGCDGCGGLSFLPCGGCNGSCKVVEGWGSDAVVVRCGDCNENGLVRCPICS